jgi:hypothetical protein
VAVERREFNLATWDVVSVASDIAQAGTALAGLILVYLGAVAVRYETLDSKAQSSARDVYPSACAAGLPRHSDCSRCCRGCSDSKITQFRTLFHHTCHHGKHCAPHVIFHSSNGSVLDSYESRLTQLLNAGGAARRKS